MQINDFDIIQNVEYLQKKQIILYGAGNVGKEVLDLLNAASIKIIGFCDKNINKKIYFDYLVIHLSKLVKKVNLKDCLIIVCSKLYCDDMINDLEENNIESYICTWYGVQCAIELNIDKPMFSDVFRTLIKEKKKIELEYFFQYYRIGNLLDLNRKTDAIFVYSPEKVGSTTIWKTLEKENIPVIHIHQIMTNNVTSMKEEIFQEAYKRQIIFRKLNKNPLKIITLVREPIGRAISCYMQAFSHEVVRLNIDNKICESAENFVRKQLESDCEFQWFEEEIKALTGIDIFEHFFDKRKGYALIKKESIEILILKMEQINDNLNIIGKFVGRENLQLVKANVGSQKNYKYIYQELKRRVQIPQEIIKKYYINNRYFDHFYTQEEKLIYLEKWKNNITENENI